MEIPSDYKLYIDGLWRSEVDWSELSENKAEYKYVIMEAVPLPLPCLNF